MRRWRQREQGRALHLCGWSETKGSQLVEFAVALPLLAVFVVGIFDFGAAFNVKQKLSNAAREGARVAAESPTNDIQTALPLSVVEARSIVDAYLQDASVNDCGLLAATATHSSGSLQWEFDASTGCPGTLKLTIERGYVFQETTLKAVATQVTISYPYKWSFNRVIGLLVSGTTYAGVSQIQSNAIVVNQN